jgi:site-specific recombinase XerD
MGKKRIQPNYRRRVLRLPDLDHCKTAVLNSLGSPASRRVYEYAIDQFIAWYCSEPRLAFNRIVVVRYRLYLESRHLAANTINQQLAAVRRLAHEAADAGLLSPELAAGISRVKGVKQLGFRSGNWLSTEQSSEVLKCASGDSMRAKRDYAMLAMLFGCGFRRSELVGLEFDDIQMRQGHWAVVDLIGKGGHIRTVPIPVWVKAALDQWTRAAGVSDGKIFRAVARLGKVWGDGISQNVVWYVVRTCCEKAGLEHIAPHDLRRTCAKLCRLHDQHTRRQCTNRDGRHNPAVQQAAFRDFGPPLLKRAHRVLLEGPSLPFSLRARRAKKADLGSKQRCCLQLLIRTKARRGK